MRHFSFNCALFALLTFAVRADITATWNGTTGNWSDTARWSGGVTPQNSGPNLYDAVINSGTVTLSGAFTVNQLELGGGTLGGLGPLTVLEGLAWSGGSIVMPATGLVQLGAASASTVSGNVTFSSGVIRGGGGATFIIQPGATLTVEDGANLFAQVSTPAWTLTNSGTLTARNTSGGGFITLDAALAGNGVLRVENTGASHTFSLAGGGTLGGSVFLDANTTLELGGTLTVAAGVTFSGSGTVASAGTVTLDGNAVVPALTVPAGELRLAGKTLAVSGGAVVDDFGTLVTELRGTSAALVSRLTVGGALSVYGSLHVTLGAGFNPSAGDTFDILDFAAITGTFSTVQFPALPSGLFWRTDRLYTEGKITVSSVAPTYAEWQLSYGIGGFGADDDKDGIPNGVEFALGIRPDSASGANGAISQPRASILNGRMRLHFEMPDSGANDITLKVEVSNDHGRSDPWMTIATKVGSAAWSGPGAVMTTGVPGGRIAVTVADTDLVANHGKRFLRLAVVLP